MARRGSPQASPPRGSRSIRCAIYTRKSTDEGLEQEFNSLDAQREACAAYILSQRHEGWTLVPEPYDDGGFFGGSMDRPALQQLMKAVAAGKVDVIVVYKVDRLTRSLADFAKIVEVLDAKGASFVSVTQAFNTTTSMGRLTLNVLLSFAQFEREVTSERIRDKVAASKKKGMWMGGGVPLGYEVKERKLVIHDPDAETVRRIFRRYVELGALGALAEELDAHAIRSRRRILANGDVQGGRRFSKGGLAHLLQNRTYIGEVTHKGVSYPGEHEALIDRATWDAVQAQLAGNRNANTLRLRADNPSLLAGMIVDGEGRRMTPSHATKGSRRYRYYVTAPVHPSGKAPASGWRVPAGDIEQLVQSRIASWLGNPATIVGCLSAELPQQQLLQDVLAGCRDLAQQLESMTPAQLRALLLAIDARLAIASEGMELHIDAARLAAHVLGTGDEPAAPLPVTIPIEATLERRGQELRLHFPADDQRSPAIVDVRLLGIIAKAEAAHRKLVSGEVIDAAQRPHLVRLARLKFLAPDIVSAILDGRQPARLAARQLYRAASLPICWREQRRTLGFA